MASEAASSHDAPHDVAHGAALQHSPWRRLRLLSRGLAGIERFLANSGFDRAPWLVVAFGAGIAAWFILASAGQWLAFMAFGGGVSCLALATIRSDGSVPYLRQALIALPLMAAAGTTVVWSKSELVGAPPIERPLFAQLDATVIERQEQPADERIRLILATREPESGRPMRIRLNLPKDMDDERIVPNARIRLSARLMPPAPPMLPGAYNFARTAWFSGLSATGTALGAVEILRDGRKRGILDEAQGSLSSHIRDRLEGSVGGIAATLASGDRGAIEKGDAQAMRDAGLAHLLSISGLHVSAVIAVTYLIALRLMALWPWLALRVRLPLLAAATAAMAGIAYTLLTGAQVPTVRSCIGALLVLAALALGREALSLRVLAVAAFLVLLLWPESLVGPSFQMSFAAVMAIIALNSSGTVRRFLGPREEGWLYRGMRYATMLFLTSLLIEIVLMPIGLYHFHRAGIYGSFANVIAIPLTTLFIMPVIAIALLLDVVGAGAPAWWLAGKAIVAIIDLAHWVSSQPGAVTTLPAMGAGSFGLFVLGGLWLALWNGKVRFLGLVSASAGALSLALLNPPDILVSGDGRHVGITGEADGGLIVLRNSRSDFVRDNLSELAGMDGTIRPMSAWPGARCSRDFCAIELIREGRNWHVLMARSREHVPERALAAACDRADIVIADRWLPRSCKPAWVKADRRMLSKTGGMAIDLTSGRIRTVADEQGRHGWWRPGVATRGQ